MSKIKSFAGAFAAIKSVKPLKFRGKVTQVKGQIVESQGPFVEVGTTVSIKSSGKARTKAQVIGFSDDRYILVPFEESLGIQSGFIVEAYEKTDSCFVSRNLLGRVVNCFGEPIDGKGEIVTDESVALYNAAPKPLERKMITEVFETRIKAIDIFLTTGKGQRVGIFSSAGLGKSTLLGMLTRFSKASVNVICLIGERGREVKEFLERDLVDGLEKSVVVVSTADENPLKRVRAAFLALRYAEYFRELGEDVLFVCDSLTRLAQSLREIGFALGELPSQRGYPSSVFQILAKYLERLGNSKSSGSLTSFLSVLVEGDDLDEPVSDNVKAILDGHIILTRELANKNHYPAIDILKSISRVAPTLQNETEKKVCMVVKNLLSHFEEYKDMVAIGAYKPGSDQLLDLALQLIEPISLFLQQTPDQACQKDEAIKDLLKVLKASSKV